MTHGPAHMELEWRVLSAQARSIAAALQGVMLATRQEAGCVGCVVCTSARDLVTVRYVEDWDCEESLRRQVRSERFRTLAMLVESAIAPPRVEFVLPDGTHGMEYAEKVRGVS